MTKVKINTKIKSEKKSHSILLIIIIALIAGLLGAGVNVVITENNESVEVDTGFQIELSEEQIPAVLEGDMGEIIEETYPTVEEVDGGLFEDEDTGVSLEEGEYADLGWSETYNVSSPEAFKNDTLGKCIVANNKYGAQCVSLARVFWWSYANRDVTTCGTGMAKGMMNCAEQNADDEFKIYWKNDANKIQAGDWLIFEGGLYGHVGMALGPVTNGYVALLGENQGGKACEGGGSATNIININIKNLIGFYRPKSYIKVEPKPILPSEPAISTFYTVKKGDTLGAIARTICKYKGKELFGDKGYTEKLAIKNGIKNRGLIFIGQKIKCL